MRYQAIWREAFQLAHQATQERTQSMTRLMSVRLPQQLLDANIDLLKREVQMYLDGQARLSQSRSGKRLSLERPLWFFRRRCC